MKVTFVRHAVRVSGQGVAQIWLDMTTRLVGWLSQPASPSIQPLTTVTRAPAALQVCSDRAELEARVRDQVYPLFNATLSSSGGHTGAANKSAMLGNYDSKRRHRLCPALGTYMMERKAALASYLVGLENPKTREIFEIAMARGIQ